MRTNKKIIDKIYHYKILNILKSPLFWIGVFIKLTCSALFASSFLANFFAPFVNFFISSGFENPYRHILSTGVPEAFPYPALMLYILSIPGAIFSPLLSPDFVSHIDIFVYTYDTSYRMVRQYYKKYRKTRNGNKNGNYRWCCNSTRSTWE